MYDPTIGRWFVPDPIDQFFDFSPYGFVLNNPMNLTDPDGMQVGKDLITKSVDIVSDAAGTGGFAWTVVGKSAVREATKYLPSQVSLALGGLNFAKETIEWFKHPIDHTNDALNSAADNIFNMHHRPSATVGMIFQGVRTYVSDVSEGTGGKLFYDMGNNPVSTISLGAGVGGVARAGSNLAVKGAKIGLKIGKKQFAKFTPEINFLRQTERWSMYGVNDEARRFSGPWKTSDIKSALYGYTPKSFGMPQLHHAEQMPGSAIHEIDAYYHRTNPYLHPNKWNQGVNKLMRDQDRYLHWWYRAREQGADQLFPNNIYD